jgi:sulfur carrier protein
VSIYVNGDASSIAPGTTVAGLLDALAAPTRGVAVAVDTEVVPRGEWETFAIPDGSRVEVLIAVQGG